MTIKEFAKICGVSVATVSRVFNEPEKVKEETRERILRIAKEYNYTPHSVAKSLREKRTGIYALTVMSTVERVFEDSYVSKFLRGAVKYFSEHGLKLVVDVLTSGDVRAYYTKLVKSRLIDGVILMDLKDDDERVELLKYYGFPFVCVGRNNKNDFVYVDSDGYLGGRQAGEHFLELGVGSVIFIGGDPNLPFERDRRKGFSDALEGSGISIVYEYAFYEERNVRDILETYVGRIEGIFCTSDVMAYAALRFCERNGLDVPIVGFDNILLSEIAGITTVDQHIELVGEKAAEKLHKVSLGEPVGSEIIVTELVVRSTKRFMLRKARA
ncbi:LacI family transcriptional regulator [Fervidobacterium thailandense]|uniref:LacI family transcriptional regulator n=1 Tax=Fervidobacterium thailandense TaxID=1008305 RepID=A0A1E3G0E6_9BACT|nr:LacI family transcriptional regulator [Fervidobacterium thailandense]